MVPGFNVYWKLPVDMWKAKTVLSEPSTCQQLVKQVNKLCLFYLFLVSVFRQGDLGLNWYAVLGGQLEVRREHPSKDSKEKVCR